VLPPTTFDLFAFKTFFVNHADKRGEGMKFFFENYDKEGYSIYFVHYDKYEGECQVLYQTANMLGGFLQRIDHFRKHTFAAHAILGEEPTLEI
jgi:elongation factor 1-gamma